MRVYNEVKGTPYIHTATGMIYPRSILSKPNGAWYNSPSEIVSIPMMGRPFRIASDSDRRLGIWQIMKSEDGSRLYLSCPRCGEINDATMNIIPPEASYPDRLMGDCCVVCLSCCVHFFPKLIGYTASQHNRISKTRYKASHRWEES